MEFQSVGNPVNILSGIHTRIYSGFLAGIFQALLSGFSPVISLGSPSRISGKFRAGIT